MMYDFVCKKCNVIWEASKSMKLSSEERKDECPECGRSCPSIVTGGTGFMMVDRNFNPVRGFPSNEFKKEAEIADTEKELDDVIPKLPQNMVDKAHKKIKKAGEKGKQFRRIVKN